MLSQSFFLFPHHYFQTSFEYYCLRRTHIGSLRAWGDTKGNILSCKIADEETWNFSLLICGSIAGVWIDCFSRKKIDGFVTQYAQTVGSVCCTLSMENDSGSICFKRKTLLRNSSFDKSDSLSIPNLFFTSDDVTYLPKRFQKQKPLPQCDTLREKRGNDTLVSAYGSIFFVFFCLTVLILLQQLWQNLRVSPSKKLCDN